MRERVAQRNVLVGVLKDKRDLKILLREHWYRIPLAHLPKRPFIHLAFYQPASFDRRGKRIEYYARVLKKEILPRSALLPRESRHSRAHDLYAKFTLGTPRKLALPIRNVIPRRVSFGFTDLKTLLSARDILELYHVPKTEQIIAGELKHRHVPFTAEHTVSAAKGHSVSRSGPRRVRVDLAIFCKKGKIAIECDNKKAHASKSQRAKDKAKDEFLKKLGWQVVRLSEPDIIEHRDRSAVRIQNVINILS